jgi:isopentenyldiphosphate isomerase
MNKKMVKKVKIRQMVDMITEEDEVIGKMTLDEAIKGNLLHRDVVVFVFNGDGELFFQKRSKNKSREPGKYDISCSGAVHSGEAYQDAVERVLKKELGITTLPAFIRTIRYKNNDANYIGHVYSMVWESSIDFKDSEVEDGKFISKKDLKKFFSSSKVTDEAKELVEEYFEEAKEIALS